MKKIIDKIDYLGSKRMIKYEDPVTRGIPYFAVTIFLGLILYVVYDSFMVIR